MRKAFVIGTVIVSLFAFAPSHARVRQVAKKQITFHAPVACTTLCAHNLDGITSDLAGEAAAGGSVAAETAGVADPAIGDPTQSAVSTCGDPFPLGGYADFVVTAPKGANTLEFTITPTVDWDSYICSKPARGKSKVLASGANSATDCQIGCVETTTIRVKPGAKYILRAYNWADATPCPGQYRFLNVS